MKMPREIYEIAIVVVLVSAAVCSVFLGDPPGAILALLVAIYLRLTVMDKEGF